MKSNTKLITLKIKSETKSDILISDLVDIEAMYIQDIKKELIEDSKEYWWHILIEYTDNEFVLRQRRRIDFENRKQYIYDYMAQKEMSVRAFNGLVRNIDLMLEKGFKFDSIYKFRNLGVKSIEKYKDEIEDIYNFVMMYKKENPAFFEE
jgi:hypothetical protein